MRPLSLSAESTGKLFGVVIFLSSFLLFAVEPLIAKYILPWFGGAAAVWQTSLIFFMLVLLAGYGYAHALTRLDKKTQALLHGALTLACLALIAWLFFKWETPITPPRTSGKDILPYPALGVLGALTLGIGLPYFFLSSVSSLLQAWYTRLVPAASPYRFYAVSNLGSLIALICYPFVIEPYLTIRLQGLLWSAFFVVCGLGIAGALLIFYSGRENTPREMSGDQPGAANRRRTSPREALRWLSLAFVPAFMLFTTTNEITLSVASAPFLWLAPLGAYLISFILCFRGAPFGLRDFFGFMLFMLLALTLTAASWTTLIELPYAIQIGMYVATLFLISMLCHGELYENRPEAGRLTLFYFLVSLGGALGGLTVGILAPIAFPALWEVPIGFMISIWFAQWAIRPGVIQVLGTRPAIWGARALLFLLGSSLLLNMVHGETSSLYRSRNFYGTIQISEGGNLRVIKNGSIIHGSEITSGDGAGGPTAYYTGTSGIGLALTNHAKRLAGKEMRVGVIGLGSGTIAAYCRPGDYFRFYEINPEVIMAAGKYFTYLPRCKNTEVVAGDARAAMAEELKDGKPQNFDLLALDAFSDDAIPVHLLTEEAFSVYLEHLAPGGILAIHISNRHLDLLPVVKQAALRFGLALAFIESEMAGGRYAYRSQWILTAPDPGALAAEAIRSADTYQQNGVVDIPLWTDNYNNLFRILK